MVANDVYATGADALAREALELAFADGIDGVISQVVRLRFSFNEGLEYRVLVVLVLTG